jgi:hypothetical protein
VLTQRPFASGPALNETIALGARHRTRPNDAGGDIRDLGQNGIVTIAVQDGLFETFMQRSFPARQKPGSEQHPVRPKRKRCRETAAIRDAAGGENRHWRDRIHNHRRQDDTGHPCDMAATFSALRHDDVGPSGRPAFGLGYPACH